MVLIIGIIYFGVSVFSLGFLFFGFRFQPRIFISVHLYNCVCDKKRNILFFFLQKMFIMSIYCQCLRCHIYSFTLRNQCSKSTSLDPGYCGCCLLTELLGLRDAAIIAPCAVVSESAPADLCLAPSLPLCFSQSHHNDPFIRLLPHSLTVLRLRDETWWGLLFRG